MSSKYENQIKAVYTVRDYLFSLNTNDEIIKNYASMRPFEKTFDEELANYLLCLMFVDNETSQFDVDVFNSIFDAGYTLESFREAKSKANYNRYLGITEVLAQADLLSYKRNAYISCGGTPISKTFIELIEEIGKDIILSDAKISSSEKLYYTRVIKVANSTIDQVLGAVPGWNMGRKFTKAPELPSQPDLSAYTHFDSTLMNTSKALNDLMSSIQSDIDRMDAEAKDQASRINDVINLRPINPYAPTPSSPASGSGSKPAAPAAGSGEQATKAEDKPEAKVDERSLDELMEELNSLIGLTNVKKEVNSLTNLLKVNKIRKERNLPAANVSLHLVFYGNPGTGKTTVARLLAGIYKQLGFLSKGQCIEVDRGGLVGGYVGQTALKTKEVIDSALGGVLFIDEAYALTSNRGENDFGQEAVDTLLKAMEDNREDFVVIVAGYPDLMEEFVNSNPGLKSRFTRYMEFKDYTVEELMQIFERFMKKAGFTCTDECRERINEYFSFAIAAKTENFANARFVRNTFEQIVANQANRIAEMTDYTDEELMQLTVDDLSDDEDEADEEASETEEKSAEENSEAEE